MTIIKPKINEYPNYCQYFFDLVQDDLMLELEKTKNITLDFIKSISLEKENFSYQEGKWTTKEVLRHIIDCERVYTYRAFRFSRFDGTELKGFYENLYISNTKNLNISLSDIETEYERIRNSTISLFQPMNLEMLDFKGNANKVVFTARSLGFMTVGHNLHHINFLKNNYFN